MYPSARQAPEDVARVTERALGCRVVRPPEHLRAGWGNENWLVRSEEGERFVVKFGPPESAAKWAATRVAYEWAEELRIPASRLVYFDGDCVATGEGVVRILRWIEGLPPEAALVGDDARERFFAELGAIVARLHSRRLEGFSSRLDGSAPRFPDWAGYVGYRLPQILDRATAADAFAPGELRGLEHEVLALAEEVGPVPLPSLCHRDIHLGNLLATDEGGVAGLLDFDGAEAWDPAIDVVKLRWLVFPRYAGAAAAFGRSYFATGKPPSWDRRVRLVELMELVNSVANARASADGRFEGRARARLGEVLAT